MCCCCSQAGVFQACPPRAGERFSIENELASRLGCSTTEGCNVAMEGVWTTPRLACCCVPVPAAAAGGDVCSCPYTLPASCRALCASRCCRCRSLVVRHLLRAPGPLAGAPPAPRLPQCACSLATGGPQEHACSWSSPTLSGEPLVSSRGCQKAGEVPSLRSNLWIGTWCECALLCTKIQAQLHAQVDNVWLLAPPTHLGLHPSDPLPPWDNNNMCY